MYTTGGEMTDQDKEILYFVGWEPYEPSLINGKYFEWISPDGESYKQPPNVDDLNFLFREVVPKLNEEYRYAVNLYQVPGSLNWECQIVMVNCSVVVTYNQSPTDPTKALKQAIMQVVRKGN